MKVVVWVAPARISDLGGLVRDEGVGVEGMRPQVFLWVFQWDFWQVREQ